MKKFFRNLGGLLLPIGRVKRGLGLGELKKSYSSLASDAKEMFTHDKNKHVTKETFEEAIARYNLTEEDIASRKKNLLVSSLFYAGIAVALFCYTLYLLFSGVLLGSFIGLVLTAMALGLGFRDHFWYTQIKQRRLGLSVREWFDYSFRGKK